MKILMRIIILLLSGGMSAGAQELFVFNEPASNMPAKSVGIRVSNMLMDETAAGRLNYHLIPEIMWGVNKNLMLHIEGFGSNRNNTFNVEGGAIYAKYRFFSRDQVYRHFRMSAFGRVSTNDADVHQEELDLNGHNTGYQLGVIGTQLLHKLALSSTVSWAHVTDNGGGNEFPKTLSENGLNYSVSAGQLIFPKNYTGYKQTNMNLMVEFLGQTLTGNGKMYIDVAPSVQFIFNSQTRVDIGYRRELYSNMLRTAPNGFLIRVEHLLFNVF